MLKITVTGHIGQDATVREWNNQHFAAFSVANTESYTDGQGVKHETTEWISCLKRIKEGSGVVQYMKKGTKVYVEGQLSKKMFEKNGQMTCGLNCNVSYFEFLSSKEPTAPPIQPITELPPLPPVPGDGSDDLPF